MKTIKSRYLNTVPSQYYSKINISGTTLIGNKTSGLASGYIWVPYIIENTQYIEYQRMKLLEERKKKLEKLAKIN